MQYIVTAYRAQSKGKAFQIHIIANIYDKTDGVLFVHVFA